jgi:hypothetical protein
MLPVLVWTLVALVAAAAVVLVASGGDRRGAGFLADLRAGVSARRHPDAEHAAAARAFVRTSRTSSTRR